MFSIGDFARHGRVSVRMPRHYDAIGLLRPAHVDPVTGYRSYQASQLNSILALKDPGFTLDQVGAMLDEQVSVEGVRAHAAPCRVGDHPRREQQRCGLQLRHMSSQLAGNAAKRKTLEVELT